MTTLVGIKTNLGLDYIVLASDVQEETKLPNGTTSRARVKKLRYGRDWVLGYCGGSESQALAKFIGIIRGDKRYKSSKERAEEAIKNALDKERMYFQEVIDLNGAVEGEDYDEEYKYEFLFGTRHSQFGLWKIRTHGRLFEPPKENEFDYIVIGSGADSAERFIMDTLKEGKIGNDMVDQDNINYRVAVKLAKGAVQAAYEDPFTGMGYDLIVLPKDRQIAPVHFYHEIEAKLKDSDSEIEELMASRFPVNPPEKEPDEKPAVDDLAEKEQTGS
jgi:20S proteasome alpha/beta subunit